MKLTDADRRRLDEIKSNRESMDGFGLERAVEWLIRLIDRLAQEPDCAGVDANRCEHQYDRCPHQYDLCVLMCDVNHKGCEDRQRKEATHGTD